MQINRVKRKLIDCAHFVPEDVASGDLSDSADFRIYKLRISNAGLGSTPPPGTIKSMSYKSQASSDAFFYAQTMTKANLNFLGHQTQVFDSRYFKRGQIIAIVVKYTYSIQKM
jgi:hypothetical protein